MSVQFHTSPHAFEIGICCGSQLTSKSTKIHLLPPEISPPGRIPAQILPESGQHAVQRNRFVGCSVMLVQ